MQGPWPRATPLVAWSWSRYPGDARPAGFKQKGGRIGAAVTCLKAELAASRSTRRAETEDRAHADDVDWPQGRAARVLPVEGDARPRHDIAKLKRHTFGVDTSDVHYIRTPSATFQDRRPEHNGLNLRQQAWRNASAEALVDLGTPRRRRDASDGRTKARWVVHSSVTRTASRLTLPDAGPAVSLDTAKAMRPKAASSACGPSLRCWPDGGAYAAGSRGWRLLREDHVTSVQQ